MKTNLELILMTMITLAGIGISSAQTSAKSISRAMVSADTGFAAEPITLETPTAKL